MKYDPYEKYANDHIANCELCCAFPPNAYGEAYGSGLKHHCRCIGVTISDKTPACSMFSMDERIAEKVRKFESEVAK